MRYKELTKKLKRLGCEYVRQGSGSHEIWKNERTQGVTVIPRHNKEIAKGTLNKILKDLGFTLKDLQ